MADHRKKRYNLAFDDSDISPKTSVKKRSSTKSESRNSSRINTRDTESRSYEKVNIDTAELSRNLEAQADDHISRNRRDRHYRNAGDPVQETERRTYSSSAADHQVRSSRGQRTVERERAVRDMDMDHEERYKERKRLRREAAKWRKLHWYVRFLILIFLVADLLIIRFGIFSGGFLPVWNVLTSKSTASDTADAAESGLPINQQLLTVNEYSRPGTKLEAVNGIVVHYIGNPGTDAQANRDYFEGLQDGSSGTYSSCNYIIGLDGTIIQCVPDDEVAYASGERNSDTISIECCHPDESGAFTAETFNSLVLLTAKLCSDYGLSTDQILRHYDVNGKPCPKFFVDDPDSWVNFIASVEANM